MPLFFGLEEGNYRIEYYTRASLPIGIESSGDPEAVPLIIGGKENVFTLTRSGFNFNLTLHDPASGPRSIAIEDDKLVAPLVVDSAGGGSERDRFPWSITGPKDGPFAIAKIPPAIGPMHCWTLDDDDDDAPAQQVIVKLYTPWMDSPQWRITKHELPESDA